MNQDDEAMRLPEPPELTNVELQALIYFAIGTGSEGGDGGRDVSNRLSFAGNVIRRADGTLKLDPVGNSGFSLGMLQSDLGQHPGVAGDLVAAYQTWARVEEPGLILSDAQQSQTIADLSRNGRTIDRQDGRPLDVVIKERLESFLASEEGITFVHGRDMAQVDVLMAGALSELRETSLFLTATPDDQVRLATIVAKLENQSGTTWAAQILRNIDNGSLLSVSDVGKAIDGLVANRRPDQPDYMESGRDHALSGADVFIGLRSADPASPLHATWQQVLANPLVNPARVDEDQARPNLDAEYATIKNLFLQKTQAPAFIDALDRGGAYAYGRPQQEGNRAPTAGLYAMGDDFVVWNRDGSGHSNIGGVWSDIAGQDLSRTRNADGSTDLNLARDGTRTRLLHVDPSTPELRAALVPDRLIPDAGRFEHPLLQQARAQVHRLDASLGRAPDEASECMIASLACLARENGFRRIDHVLLSEKNEHGRRGENVFIVQGRMDDPAHLRTYMKTDVAVRTPTDESFQRLEQLDRQLAEQHARQTSLQEQQTQRSDAPRRTL